MKLTTETAELLKNFSAINGNLVVGKGSAIKTVAEAKNIMASATVTETFDTPFGIYDLNQFLAVLGLFTDPDLEFRENDVVIKDTTGRKRLRYSYADQSILTTPKKDVKFPGSDVQITLTEDDLAQVRKAASVLSNGILSVRNEDGKIALAVTDTMNSGNGNEFTLDLDVETDKEFDFQISIPALKVLPGDYEVNFSGKGLCEWKHSQRNVTYWIALEKTSEFNG